MNKKVRIGILGCADIVKRRAAKAFQSIENAEFISIASRDYNKAKEWAANFNIKAEESYDSMLSNKDIDAVYIPLPVGLHKEWVLKAANAGKHIICEKSLAESLESVKEMVGECRFKGVILYENFMCDFHPQHAKVISLIKKNSIGKPFIFRGYFGFKLGDKGNIRFSKKLGGGSLNDLGAYTVFMARKIFGEEPLSVMANLFYGDGEVDIKGNAILKFPEEKSALVGFSFDSMYQNSYSLWGQEGIINVKRAYTIFPNAKPEVELVTNEDSKEIVEQVDILAVDHFELIFRDFCDTILNKSNRKNKIDIVYSKILSQARVMEALRISSIEKRSVKITNL